MKNKLFPIVGILVSGSLLFSCSKNSTDNTPVSLKQSINTGAGDLKTAMQQITASPGYNILTLSDGGMKTGDPTDSTYRVYINLDTVKGVYDYKPVPWRDRMGHSLIRFFKRTADNSDMIVRMPLSKVVNPRTLRHYSPEDTTLANNFSIDVSDYHNNYNNYFDYDYRLVSAISVDQVAAGNLEINSVVSPGNGRHYASQYAFTGSYTVNYQYDSGDTTRSSFSINEGDKVLYRESLQTIRNDTLWFGREHLYTLTIGDVQITRNSATHKVEVSVNGVVQPNAVVTIVDREDDEEASLCRHRDIQITFEDGTTTTVSALIGDQIDNIRTLFDSLHQVYFAAYVVDWIAYDIYYNRD